jgi:hypothetical protein
VTSKPIVDRDMPIDFLRYELQQIRARLKRRLERERVILRTMGNVTK